MNKKEKIHNRVYALDYAINNYSDLYSGAVETRNIAKADHLYLKLQCLNFQYEALTGNGHPIGKIFN